MAGSCESGLKVPPWSPTLHQVARVRNGGSMAVSPTVSSRLTHRQRSRRDRKIALGIGLGTQAALVHRNLGALITLGTVSKTRPVNVVTTSGVTVPETLPASTSACESGLVEESPQPNEEEMK